MLKRLLFAIVFVPMTAPLAAQTTTNQYLLDQGNGASGDGVITQYSSSRGYGWIGIGTATPLSELGVFGDIVAGGLYNADQVLVGGQHVSFNYDYRLWSTNPTFNPNAYAFDFNHSAGQGSLNPTESLALRIFSPTGGVVEADALTVVPSGDIGFGTDTPQATVHIGSPQQTLATSAGPWGNGNLVIQAYGGRTTSAGAALSFANDVTTNQGVPWEQGRIITVGDATDNWDASGRMYLQTRFSPGNGYWDWRSNLILTSNGNVGIGLSSNLNQIPTAPLEVDGNIKLTANSGANITFQDGSVQTVAWNGTTLGGDYAESIDVLGDRATYEPGDVIAIDGSAPGKFLKSSTAYSRLVAGVYSTKPGLVGRRTTFARIDKEAEVPMAMMGIAPTTATTENGPIEPGDLLVTSSTPGYAMKATDPMRTMGAVIGKALAPLEEGSGVIEVLISLQ